MNSLFPSLGLEMRLRQGLEMRLRKMNSLFPSLGLEMRLRQGLEMRPPSCPELTRTTMSLTGWNIRTRLGSRSS